MPMDRIQLLVTSIVSIVKETTEELQATITELQTTKDQLRLILDSTAEAIYGVDKDGRCTFCNNSCISMLGYQTQDELLGKDMHEQIHHTRRDGSPFPISECKIMKACKESTRAHVDDEVFWRADGTSFDVEYYSYPQLKNGELVGAVVTFNDITMRKREQEQIKYLSCHDSLTGLINRRCFEEMVETMDIEENLPISIVFADVNGLKMTNDIFGHTSGDLLIKKSAAILKKVSGENGVVARVGGDEFIILMRGAGPDEAQKVIRSVQEELSHAKINAVKCSMALGFDTKTDPAESIERIIENAENEMYKNKAITRKSMGSDTIRDIMNTLQERSPEEYRHFEAVQTLCECVGRALGLPEPEIRKLRGAGFLHDIGKIVLSDEMLNKHGAYSEQEKQEVQQHPAVGYRILNIFDDMMDLADSIFSHHERWDGSGYPKGLRGEEIPYHSRIIALAESYERKISGAEHPDAKTKERAIREIREQAGLHFDPHLTEVFLDLLKDE